MFNNTYHHINHHNTNIIMGISHIRYVNRWVIPQYTILKGASYTTYKNTHFQNTTLSLHSHSFQLIFVHILFWKIIHIDYQNVILIYLFCLITEKKYLQSYRWKLYEDYFKLQISNSAKGMNYLFNTHHILYYLVPYPKKKLSYLHPDYNITLWDVFYVMSWK